MSVKTVKKTHCKTGWFDHDLSLQKQKVQNRQKSICAAYKEEGWSKNVKRKQKRLVKSIEARVIAVHIVCSSKGGKTPGVDKQIYITPKDKIKLVSLVASVIPYKAKPVKTTYLPKPGTEKIRRLGITTVTDRVVQKIQSISLEPISETTADLKSFGFRP